MVEHSGEHELFFSASINDENAEAEAVVELRFHHHDPSTLSVRLQLLGDAERRSETHSKLSNLAWNYCTLYPKPPAGKLVELLGIGGTTFSGMPLQTTELDVAAVEVGLSEQAVSGAKYWAVAQIVPSGILIQRGANVSYPTGEIKREFGGDEASIDVQLQNGRVSASAICERASGEEFGNAVTKLIARTIVAGEIEVEHDGTLANLNKQFCSDLDDICTILSLCYRWPVTFYKIEYFQAGRAPVDAAFVRRKVTVPKRAKTLLDDLINVRALVDGGLNELVQKFRAASGGEDLGRAISYLAHSYSSRGLETSYFTAFAAFETAVAASEGKRAYALGAARWERLEAQLAVAIEKFLTEEQLGDSERVDLLAALAEKLPEVRRLSLRRRIATLVDTLNMQVTDLWPSGFDEGLRRAVASRNELFHAARLSEPEVLHGDLVRIRVLTERLILKILQWPDAKIWRWHDQELRQTNKPGREASEV